MDHSKTETKEQHNDCKKEEERNQESESSSEEEFLLGELKNLENLFLNKYYVSIEDPILRILKKSLEQMEKEVPILRILKNPLEQLEKESSEDTYTKLFKNILTKLEEENQNRYWSIGFGIGFLISIFLIIEFFFILLKCEEISSIYT